MIKNKIIKEDCVTGMKLLDKSSIDVIITSPPYNLNINYGIYKDDLPRNSYLNWLNDVFTEIARVMKEDGHFFLNVGYSNIDPWVGLDAANVARKHFVLQNNITWVKSIHVGDKTYGHFKPINSNRFSNPTWEHLFHFTKSGNTVCDKLAIGVPYTDKSNIERFSQVSDNRCRGNRARSRSAWGPGWGRPGRSGRRGRPVFLRSAGAGPRPGPAFFDGHF